MGLIEDRAWDHSVFSQNRDRLLAGEVAAQFLAAVLAEPRVRWLLSSEHFSVDGTLVEAWASTKNFRPRDEREDPPGGGRNAERNFRGEKRSNATHASTTAPDARLYRRGDRPSSVLCCMGYLLMENRHGLVVDVELTSASGTAAREAALAMLARRGPWRSRFTLGADKAYDARAFIGELRRRRVTPTSPATIT